MWKPVNNELPKYIQIKYPLNSSAAKRNGDKKIHLLSHWYKFLRLSKNQNLKYIHSRKFGNPS